MKHFLIALALSVAAYAAPTCCSTNKVPAGTPMTDGSIYQAATSWRSDYRKPFKLEQLRGKPQLVTMFFASCEFACPVLMYDLGKIDERLKEAGITDIGYVLVTIDPERDTPERLHEYRKQRNLDDRWTLLHGQNDDVMELAALLGVKFKKEARGQFAHSNIITLLNAEGEIVHQQIGLNQDPAALVTALKSLMAPTR